MLEIVHESHTFRAARALLEELSALSDQLRTAEEQVAALREKRARVTQAFEAIRIALSDGERTKLDQESFSLPTPRPNLTRISAPARALIDRLRTDLGKTWRVEELQVYLAARGEEVSDKYASNTLRKLYEQGLLIRIGRGKYRAKDTILSIEGLDDMDTE
jgi:hypothetical protein